MALDGNSADFWATEPAPDMEKSEDLRVQRTQGINNGEVFIFFSYFFGIFFLFLVPWSPAALIPWCPGHLVTAISSPYCLVPDALVSWSSGPLIRWSPGPLVPWSAGPLVLWSSGPLVPWSPVPFSFSFFLTCLLPCFTICFIYSLCLLFMFLLLV